MGTRQLYDTVGGNGIGGGRLERGNDRARGGIKMGVVAKEVVVNAKLFVSLLKTLLKISINSRICAPFGNSHEYGEYSPNSARD